MQRIKRFFLPITTNVSNSEMLISGISAFVAIGLLSLFSYHLIGTESLPFIVASMGASAVLVFAIPHSPLSQPWPVFGGHLISATVGVTSFLFIDNIIMAAAVATSVSIILMYFTRSLHPPGGAAALGVVIGGPEIHQLGYFYVVLPVALNAALIIILAVLINRLIPDRRYPAVEKKKVSLNNVAAEWALGTPRFDEDDLRSAIKSMDSYIDISQEDLARIYAMAVMNANKRRLGEVRCEDIMASSPLTFYFDEELESAWQTLQQRNVKAAPIIDSFNHPIGIVTITDFVRNATDQPGDTKKDKLLNLLKRSPGHTSEKHEVVGQIMSKEVNTALEGQHIVDLVAVFTEKGFHHMPVVDGKNRVIGMITRADVMRSMIMARS